MSQLRIERGAYVLAIVSGDIDMAIYTGMAKMLVAVARHDATRLILIDCIATTANGLSDDERRSAAAQFRADLAELRVALTLPTAERIAAAQANIADPVGLAIFRTRGEAEAWLLALPRAAIRLDRPPAPG